jgi:CelD/BcsL family acetyltransferase involved in cellulose biosynthesis
MDMTWPRVEPQGSGGAKPQIVLSAADEKIDVAIWDNLLILESEWIAFQDRAAGTFFQTYHWCQAWVETVGAAISAAPRIVTGRYEDGQLAFLLPLCSRPAGRLTIIEWMATGQSGYGYGLYEPSFLTFAREWFQNHGWDIVRQLGPADVLYLRDMPMEYHGYPHPLSEWFSFAGANSSHIMRLERDFDLLYREKRSPESRRGKRKRDAKLFSAGNAVFGLPGSPAETHALLDAMFSHQKHRLSESGISKTYSVSEKAFIHRMADLTIGEQPLLLPYHLKADGKLIAMMLGGAYGRTYWALISSLASGHLRKYSPGDAALRRTIEACCERGFTAFDFSSGDMPYKFQWADRSIRLHDTVRAITWKGLGWAFSQTVMLLGKRLIKRSPLLWTIADAARKRMGALRVERRHEAGSIRTHLRPGDADDLNGVHPGFLPAGQRARGIETGFGGQQQQGAMAAPDHRIGNSRQRTGVDEHEIVDVA